MNESVKAFHQNKAEIKEAELREKQLTEEIAREENREKLAFEQVYEEGSKLKPGTDFISSVLFLFPDRLSLREGSLCFHGVAQERKVCSPSELMEFVRTFLTNAYDILRNRDKLDARLEKLASLHQSIMHFIYHREAYEAEYFGKFFEEKKEELSDLRKRLEALRERERELSANLRAQTKKNPLDASHGLKCATSYAENIVIPLGRCDFRAGEETFPVYGEWNLRERGILCVDVSEEDMAGKEFHRFLKGILLQCLFCYPAIAKRLLLCDHTANGQIISFAGRVSEFAGGLFLNAHHSVMVDQSESEIGTSLLSVNEMISRRIVLLGRSGDADILAYNARNPDNIQPLIFVLLNGYPNGCSQSYEALGGALKNGKKAGVYFILVSDSNFKADDTWTNRKLPAIDPDNRLDGTFREEKGSCALTMDNLNFIPEWLCSDQDETELLRKLGEQIAENRENISFLSVIPEEEFSSSPRRENFSRVLSVPIGKVGAKPFSLDLDSTGDAHVMVCGTTGSGKSSLLNTVILSACMLYSPQELEINLISITKSEFNIFSENSLPHLKTIITSDNVVGANDILDYLSSVMQKRMNKIGSKSDITMYNASAAKEEKIPRCLIIIDEYQRLISESRARDKLREIAELGRSCGISLMLASQTVPVEFHGAMTLFRHRFEFRGSTIGDLIPNVAHRQSELEFPNGMFFYGKGNDVTLARLAYAGKDAELIENINAVKNRFPQEKMKLRGEISQTEVKEKEEIPFLSPNTQRDYDENGICKVRLGRKYLTDSPIEYAFSYKNNLLCLCGEYLLTKDCEASIIKDVLYLSRKENCCTVFYLDLNKNPIWARRPTAIRRMRELWTLNAGGRFVYYSSAQSERAFDDIKDLISRRESDETVSICPVIVMITCVDQIAADSDEEYILNDLLDKGKNSNIFFVLQFNEFQRNLNEVCRKIDVLENAILLPDREIEGEKYSSAALLSFLRQTEAADVTAKDLLNSLIRSPLNPKLNLLCNKSEVISFAPYHYTDEFFEKLLED